MHRSSMLFLILIVVMAAISVYETTFPLEAPLAFARFLGLDAFIILCTSLLIGPLLTIHPKGFAQLVEPRRAIGIAAFFLTLCHIFLTVSYDYEWQIGYMLSQFPIILSSVAAIMMALLTIISSDYAVKKLGAGLWKSIQRLNYLVFVLSFAHFILEIKGMPVPGVNLAEIFAIILGIAVVVLQIWGFIIRKGKEKKLEQAKEIHLKLVNSFK